MSAPVAAISSTIQYVDDGPGYNKRFLVNVELIVTNEQEVDAVKIADMKRALANSAADICAKHITQKEGPEA